MLIKTRASQPSGLGTDTASPAVFPPSQLDVANHAADHSRRARLLVHHPSSLPVSLVLARGYSSLEGERQGTQQPRENPSWSRTSTP